jgi:hypothetical protein
VAGPFFDLFEQSVRPRFRTDDPDAEGAGPTTSLLALRNHLAHAAYLSLKGADDLLARHRDGFHAMMAEIAEAAEGLSAYAVLEGRAWRLHGETPSAEMLWPEALKDAQDGAWLSIGAQKGPSIGVQRGPRAGRFFVRLIGAVSLFRPYCARARGAGAVKDGRRPPPEVARSVLDGGEQRARLGGGGQARFLKRQLSLPVSTMSQ